MTINFISIELNNFFSYSNSKIDLRDMGFVVISGENKNPLDNALSNGSGKSAIFNALCWCLTGETLQGVSNNIENIYGDPDNCWVALEFDINNTNYYVIRYKTPRPDMKIFVDGIDRSGKGIRESTALLAKYIPDLTSELISSIIILGQGLPNRFTNNRPAQRKGILENLTKSDFMIESIKAKLESRQESLKSEREGYSKDEVIYNTLIDSNTNNLNTSKSQLASYEDFLSGRTAEELVAEFEQKIEKLTSDKKEIEEKITDKTEELSKLNSDRYSIFTSTKSECSTEVKPIEDSKSIVDTKIIELSTSIKSLRAEIKKLDSVTDVCPTCGQKLPDIHIIDTTDKKIELKSLEEEKEKATKESDGYKKTISEINNKYDDLLKSRQDSINKDIQRVENELKELNKESKETQDYLKDAEIKLVTSNNVLSRYNEVVTSITDLTIKLSECEDKLKETKLALVKVDERLSVVQSMITLAKREFRGILLKSVIEYINQKLQTYSQIIFGNSLLTFELNENAIDIKYNEKPYENLSGGEARKVDIAIQLALRELLEKQFNIHSNILVIDEVFDNLDTTGCSKIINLIENIKDATSVFIITHHRETLEISYDRELVVEKGPDSISTVHYK